jgi:hypothetical protein
MLKNYYILITAIVFSLFISGCKNNSNFSIEEFNPLANYSTKKNDSTYIIKTDLSSAVLYGIEIPTVKQLPDGKFTFSFHLENNTGRKQRFFYKLYYQNESYKFENDTSLNSENFYGSWIDADREFKETGFIEDEITIIDSFKIVGNPRDEKIYYGANPENVKLTDSIVKKYIDVVSNDANWRKSAQEKSLSNKISLNDQIYLEALWGINNFFQNQSDYNNRWKRNPRMGNYKFMLVVCNEEDLGNISDEVKNISKKDTADNFVNPFAYFLKGEGTKLKSTKIILSEKILTVSSSLNLEKGIYVDRLSSNKTEINTSLFNNTCGESNQLYHDAQFSQYFHHINKNWEFVNVKKALNVVADNLTREQYSQLISEYANSKDFVHTYSNATDCPCKTVKTNTTDKSLSIINPGNNDGLYKKEHVGIKSRIGFTYGKWRAKIRFPKNISKDNVWNGLTNAFWLLFQSEDKWNVRRPCKGTIGYIPKDVDDNVESVRSSKPQINYSEIDFEILKESQFWTQSSYGGRADYPKEDASKSSDITICCTNWDMACNEPKNFFFGAKDYVVEGKKYSFGRWDYFNKLITSKVPAPHSEVFNDDFYYFEIDWQPTRIIWRIGKDKNNMKEICRMNDEMTSIPNNQMIMLLTQEFHYQEWWPTAPFLQNYIPFPKNDLEGKLLEIEIE